MKKFLREHYDSGLNLLRKVYSLGKYNRMYEYYIMGPDGPMIYCWYKLRKGILHSKNGPAGEKYHYGKLALRVWSQNIDDKPAECYESFIKDEFFRGDCAIYHRVDGPAVEVYEDGRLYELSWFFRGRLHNDNGPANLNYHINGKVHFQEYFRHGLLHRDDGPAVICYDLNGNIVSTYHYKDGKMNNEKGPAMSEVLFGGRLIAHSWYKNGELHRLDGPAVEYRDVDGNLVQVGYYIEGCCISEEDFKKMRISKTIKPDFTFKV